MPPVVGYNRYPDEKGTERSLSQPSMRSNSCYNRYPDEKGTERSIVDQHFTDDSLSIVTTVTPMKRGLKVRHHANHSCQRGVTTVTPMKRGLKANLHIATRFLIDGYNRYPDEKGTERSIVEQHFKDEADVTTVTPMKRGLKDCKS